MLAGWGGSLEAQVRKIAGPTMGTRYAIRYVGGPAEQEVQKLVDQRLAEINHRMSTYDTRSELSRFNRHSSEDWFPVSPETAKVVAYALQVAKDSDGAFDPTVGPVVNLWGFGPGKNRSHPPTDAEIADAMASVGYRQVEARLDSPALRKTLPGVYLDLSAVAKGFAADAVSDLLDKLGCAASMVEIGGEVRTSGHRPDGQPWRIGIEQPDATSPEIGRVLKLSDAAVATSGDYRNSFENQGHRYSHIIDPHTGRPVENDLAAVTVIAETCMEADALATTLMVLGPEKGYEWCTKRRVAALFMVRSSSGETQVRSTPEFNSHPAAQQPEP